MTADYLRGCAYCSAFILTVDDATPSVACLRCQGRRGEPGMPPPAYEDWAPSVKPGDRVYLQSYEAWRGLSRSEYLVTARDGDMLTVQVLGIPESSRKVNIAHCAAQDVTPWQRYGATY